MPQLSTFGAASARGFGEGTAGRPQLVYIFSVNTADSSLDVSTISGYKAGKSDITITVNSGIYLYSTAVGTPGLALTGGSSGDTITLVNNGYIMGQGGAGANRSSTLSVSNPGNPGGVA